MIKKTIYIVVLLCLKFVLPAKAQNEIILQRPDTTYTLGLNIEYLEDNEKKLTIAEVKKTSTIFQYYPRKSINFAYKDANYWFRVRLKTAESHEWILHIVRPFIENIEIYQFNEKDSLVAQHQLGIQFPFHKRLVMYRTFVVPLSVPKNQTTTLYIHFSGSNSKQFPMEITEKSYFFAKAKQDDHIVWLIIGALLSFTIYNAFIYVSTREKSYLYYVLYMFSMTANVFIINGLFFQYVAPDYPFLTRNLLNVFLTIPSFFGMGFTIHFLRTARFFPIGYRISLGVEYVIVANILLMLVSIHLDDTIYLFSLQLSAFVIAFFTLFSFILGVRTWFKKFRPASFYVIAWSFLLLAALLASVKQLGILEDSIFINYSFQIAAVIEGLILSLGLADKINIERKQKIEAQQKSIELLTTNKRIIQEQNQMLEQKVQKRTEELNQQTLLIEEKNEDIIASLNYALRIQKAITPSLTMMQNYFSDSFVFYAPKDIVSGDFYWVAEKENLTLIALADCTGRGVSGAFMTIITNNILNTIVHNYEITAPDQIIKLIPTLLEKVLLQNQQQSLEDGMDIGILSIRNDNEQYTLQYVGAKQDLYYIENNQLQILKGDRWAIGEKRNEHLEYQLQTIQVPSTIALYLFSDGYKDQFGGEKNKKMGIAQLTQIITNFAPLPMNQQKEKFEDFFSQWKQTNVQTDDVTLIGIRLRHPNNPSEAL
ncbi:MAG: hypothetical protein EAZ55_13785 [Cytophagales bacterium]|nr:MAG: hypothetical protein EAZ55_13785 [Cytophagales bacterium]